VVTLAPVSKKEEPRISVRIPKGSDLKARLLAAAERAGVDEPTLVLRCVEATVEYIETHGEITLPLVVLPKSALKKTTRSRVPSAVRGAASSRTVLHGANEPEGDYKSRKPRK
jgi:hypothetical protein